MLKKISVTAFVDLESQLWNSGQKRETRVARQCEAVLLFVATATLYLVFRKLKRLHPPKNQKARRSGLSFTSPD